MKETIVTAENFKKEVLEAEMPVLVDFWARWCGPCNMLASVLTEIGDEFENKLIIGKINVDEEESLAEEFNINMIPCLILFSNGKPVVRITGYRDKKSLITELSKANIF